MMSHWALSGQIRPWGFAVFHLSNILKSIQGPKTAFLLLFFFFLKRLSLCKIGKQFSHGFDGTGGVTRRGLPTYRECNLFSGGTARTLREHTGVCTRDVHIERPHGCNLVN